MAYRTDNELTNYFSNVLFHLIQKKGITQKELAELIGSGQTTISRYVNGYGLPNYYMLYRLALALDCSVETFFPPNAHSRKKHVLL